ncbi:hypothetical protein CC1G_14899 [Coprinopsis cinerea okayama7|uniref:Cytochrome P450 n=1 Tax=Coprinopsis cinerea (strain Okayama-7 / 130 / ATCC MYA-4618 / FGSC 9003) TaxID=240176 RepID=D6RNL2_COPC7|nr:hypothetical protein CC1G_14899 [Coprinopsis cinerea okayama7\|eukprot:XP_002910922.1 hypothetical protein CC1G_14899 [Coprinopsis cinerea okayama7\
MLGASGLLADFTVPVVPVFIFLFGFGYAYVTRQRRPKSTFPVPPGPKRLPFIGNALQIPLEEPWKTYKEWTRLYSNVIYMEVIGQPIVILNSFSGVQDLLIKRAAKYSDRATIPAIEM